jgi:ABC-type transport system involved in multi-copper enzyme maturation permease subunit/uncharacterized RDD family membrane protein YckC
MSLLARAAAASPFRGLSPFGPIFGKELRVTSRRKRTYALRVAYLALLLLAMLWAYTVTRNRSYGGGGVAQQTAQQAALGHGFFLAFCVFCIGSMGFIGPVLTANGIGAERLAKTLPVLLMTPITAWQVVSGKLLSRALTALTLIGLSLPVLALVRLLGGVDLNVMLAALAVAVSYMLATAALGLFYSLFVNRAAVVILLSYGTLGVLYAMLPAVLIGLFRIERTLPGGKTGAFELLFAINPPFWAVSPVEAQPMAIGMSVWGYCVAVQLGMATVLVLVTAVLLRRQFRAAGEGDAPAVGGAFEAVPLPVRPVASATPPTSPPTPAAERPGPLDYRSGPATQPPTWGQADGDRPDEPRAPVVFPGRRAKLARPVSDNPVLWREVRRPLFGKVWQRVLAVCLVVGAVGLFYAMLAEHDSLKRAGPHMAFAVVFCGLWWLVSAVHSATAISQEKESDTWTLLLTTPLTGRQVVFGKAAGMFRRMAWPTALVGAHFLLFAVAGVLPLWSVLFAVGMIVACNALWVATGVWISLRVRRVTFAVIANVMLAVTVYGLVPLVVLIPADLISRRGGEATEHAMWHNPYYYLAQGFEGIDRARRPYYYYGNVYGNGYPSTRYSGAYENYRLPREQVTAGPFLLAAAACAVGHLALAGLVLSWTAGQFDEIVGRAGRRRFPGTFDAGAVVVPGGGVADGSTEDASAGTARPPSPALAAARPASGALLYAGFWHRALAWGIDAVFVGLACGAIGLAWGIGSATVRSDSDYLGEYAVRDLVLDRLAWSMTVGLLLVGWLYYAGSEASVRRATPGKVLTGLFVTDTRGGRTSFARASVRYFAKLVSAAPLMLGFLDVTTNRRRQALHDRIAGTLVLRR